jgi:hypothetical protein
VYGHEFNNAAAWSIKFDDLDFDSFVFASGDLSAWVEIKKAELITGSFYDCNSFTDASKKTVLRKDNSLIPSKITICFSNSTSNPTVYSSAAANSSELSSAASGILYAGAGSSSNTIVQTKGGADVYINKKNAPDLSQWLKVRHLASSSIKGHPATDDLAGWAVYGSRTNDAADWSI